MDDPLLRHVAERNGGYLHREDLLALGETDRSIARAVRDRTLMRIRVGTYAFRAHVETLDPLGRHVLLARATIDKLPTGSVALSHASAAAVHGIELFDIDLSVVHLTRLDGGSGRIESGIQHHTGSPAPEEIVELDGRLVVRPARAAWETACSTSARGALVVLDSTLRRGSMSSDELADTVGRYAAWRGSRRARLMARLADPGAESVGETLLRFLCWQETLPPPETQLEVVDGTGRLLGRGDLGWRLQRHLAEFDGMRKYWRDRRAGEDASDVVVREKTREDAMRAQGWGMTRTIWSDVLTGSSRATGARLRHELEQSHRLYARGRRVIA